MEKQITKNSVLLIIYTPKSFNNNKMREVVNYFNAICDENVFPLIIKSDKNKFEFEALNFGKLNDDEYTQIQYILTKLEEKIENYG